MAVLPRNKWTQFTGWDEFKMIDLEHQIACVKREIGMRERVYPRWVSAGKMKQENSVYEIEAMKAVLETMTRLSSVMPKVEIE